MRCDALADRLPAAAEGTVVLAPDERAHVERCLRCQADVAQYQRLLRALRRLRDQPVPVPPGLLDELRGGLDPGRRSAADRVRRAAYLGGIAAATAAGAIVLVRSRRRLLVAS